MTTRRLQEAGFAALDLLLIVVIVALLGAVGWYIFQQYNQRHTPKTTTTAARTAATGTPSPVPSSGSQGAAVGAITFPTFKSKMGLSTGVQLWDSSASDMDSQLAGIAATGATWVRTAVHWKDVETTSATQDNWTTADRLVSDAQKDKLSLIMDVDGAPDWAGAQQSGEYSTDPQLYATFVAKVAARYAGKVRVYELGNEPNSSNYVPTPSAATYTKLLQAAYPAIKAADPNAFVLTAGLGGGDTKINIDAVTYTTQLYQDGAKGYFDAISFHPYTYPQLASQEVSTGGRGWSKMLAVRNLMVQNGDSSKQIWVTEFGAPTIGPGAVSEAQQAAILTDGFNLWKTYSWGGMMSWFDYQDKNTDASTHKGSLGLVDITGRHKPSYDAYSALTKN